ncbi:MAG: xanthine dehydrogenase family protein molybdopterin-binding subunit [Alphaproteobacteria bacterium]|nr:xanthine dehydrogenase family protein molybdopterin-binding subunit [Alphaproteobacteria bacterium]
MKFGIGQPVRRKEDLRFLLGRGTYVDDITFPDLVHAVVLRSPHAHARIGAIDTGTAAGMQGVLRILTSADLEAAGIGTLPCLMGAADHGEARFVRTPRRALARGVVRHVGDGVALVIAETREGARDAADAIRVDYQPLPAVIDMRAAIRPESPLIWRDVPRNLAFVWEGGDRAATEAAFAAAAHVVRIELVNNRLVSCAMEPRGTIGQYDPVAERYTLHQSGQLPHIIRRQLAESVLKVPENRVRVLIPDVGGGFGTKACIFPEDALVLVAAKLVGRPVKWSGDRVEAFVADAHARDNLSTGEFALDAGGRFLGLRVTTLANLGAYLSQFGPFVPTECGARVLSGAYATPAVHATVRGVYTNTQPIDAYRGAGRPEAIYLVERLVDLAARHLGVGATELRRRNFIAPSAMPYRTPLGLTIDSGDFAANLTAGLARAGVDQAPARRRAAAARGRLYGLGIAYYIEACGGGANEAAEVRVTPTGAVTLLIGTMASGQGHQTAFAQIVAERLGVPFAEVEVVYGDTDRITHGRGTTGSRSLTVGGGALARSLERVIAKGRRIAGHLLEAAAEDVEFVAPRFRVAGTDRSVSFSQVAAAAYDHAALPRDVIEPGLDEIAHFVPDGFTFPNGCHVCELEIDPETGAVKITRYVLVDDFGTIINPLLVEGQVHGGLAQGIGQALLEECRFDELSGQLLSASFMDYAMPRADLVPTVELALNEGVPCRTNPLGVKGCGEAGAVGAPPAVVSALVDALAAFGITHIDMPATPERVWRLIQAAAARGSPPENLAAGRNEC